MLIKYYLNYLITEASEGIIELSEISIL